MRLSSKRLNVTRFGKAIAAAWRATARASLGSASSHVELIALLLSSGRHDCADRPPPIEGPWDCGRRPARKCSRARGIFGRTWVARTVTSSLAGIIMPPHFRPSTALLNCDKETLRWPGPFDTGFLSPQPPGVAGIGSIAEWIIPSGPTRVGPLSFLSILHAAVRN